MSQEYFFVRADETSLSIIGLEDNSTNEAIVRFDGSAGHTQNSLVTINDDGFIITPSSVSIGGSYQFSGFIFAERAAPYIVLRDYDTNLALFLGGAGDPTNYSRNTSINFASRDGVTNYITMSAAGTRHHSTIKTDALAGTVIWNGTDFWGKTQSAAANSWASLTADNEVYVLLAIGQSNGLGYVVPATSVTALAIGTGSKVFTTQAGLSAFFPTGASVRAIDQDTAASMIGTVTSYSGTTLTLNITSTTGSGTQDNWAIGCINTIVVPTGRALSVNLTNGVIEDANDPVGGLVNGSVNGSMYPAMLTALTAGSGARWCIVQGCFGGAGLVSGVGSGDWSDRTAVTSLFAQALARRALAVTALQNLGYTVRNAGILFTQGEADASAINATTITSTQYYDALLTLRTDFRAQLGADTPFYICRTGTQGSVSDVGYAAVRTKQWAAVAADTTGLSVIAYDGAYSFLARSLMQPDGLHYQQAGYDEAGRGVAATILSQRRVSHWLASTEPDPFIFTNDKKVVIGGTAAGSMALKIGGVSSTGTGSVEIGQWVTSDSFGAIYLNGLAANPNDFNFVSGSSDKNLYINRPSGKDVYWSENGAATTQLSLRSGGRMVLGTTLTAGWFSLRAGTTSFSQINFESGTIPSAPTDGDLTYDGTRLFFRVGATSRRIAMVSTSDVLLAYDGSALTGITFAQLSGGGDAARYVHTQCVTKKAVDFNAANGTDYVIPITLPSGCTRFIVQQIVTSGCSGAAGTLATSRIALFTAASGGGTAIKVSAAPGVTSFSEGTSLNTGILNADNGTISFRLVDVPNVYLNLVTQQGAAAVGDVTITFRAMP